MKIIKALAVAISAAFFIAGSAFAQNVGTVTNHAVPVGKGVGKQGLTSIGPCTNKYSLIFAGASSDPACGQVDLAAGVTGTLPVLNGGTGVTTVLAALQAWGLQIPNLTHKAVPVGADKIAFYDVAGAASKYSTLTELLGSITSGVSSIATNTGAFTLNATSGITNSTNDIILSQGSSSQFGAVKVDNVTILASSGVIGMKATTITNSLAGNQTFNNTGLYYDGPSMAQGTSGTWKADGTVSITGGNTGDDIYCKLWDGTTVIASATATIPTANYKMSMSLSGVLATPAANIKISCRNSTSVAGSMLFNASGNSKDSTVTGVRIQ